MQTLGLIGGMTWKSTLEYYRIINEEVHKRLGNPHSANILLASPDFHTFHDEETEGNWIRIADILYSLGIILEEAGADFLMICANTPHKVVPLFEDKISIPVINIIDETGKELTKNSLKKPALLGTLYTMSDGFYKNHLEHNYDLDVMLPSKVDMEVVHDLIFNEFAAGKPVAPSREKLHKVIDNLVQKGADSLILGCTELPLIADSKLIPVPAIDTLKVHAMAGVECSLSKTSLS